MKRYFAILSGLLFTAACNQVAGPDWSALPGSESYVLEYGTGVPRQKKLSLRESEKTLLRSYMQELADEGSSIPISYAPQYVLSGADFSLNFGQDVVVLNLRSAGNPITPCSTCCAAAPPHAHCHAEFTHRSPLLAHARAFARVFLCYIAAKSEI